MLMKLVNRIAIELVSRLKDDDSIHPDVEAGFVNPKATSHDLIRGSQNTAANEPRNALRMARSL